MAHKTASASLSNGYSSLSLIHWLIGPFPPVRAKHMEQLHRYSGNLIPTGAAFGYPYGVRIDRKTFGCSSFIVRYKNKRKTCRMYAGQGKGAVCG